MLAPRLKDNSVAETRERSKLIRRKPRLKGSQPEDTRLAAMPLTRSELPIDTATLARYLIGKVVVRALPEGVVSGRIVETEAYPVGDAAGHAYRGETRGNRALFLERGHAHVYLAYGVSWMLNVSSEAAGVAPASCCGRWSRWKACRSCRPTAGRRACATWPADRAGSPRRCASTPASTASTSASKARSGSRTATPSPATIGQSTRIGITRDADRILRFYVRGNPFVERTKIAQPIAGGRGRPARCTSGEKPALQGRAVGYRFPATSNGPAREGLRPERVLVDLFDEVDEQLRSDRYVSLFRRLAPWVTGLFALVLLGYFAFWGYKAWQDRNLATAASAYQKGVDALSQGDVANAQASFQASAKAGAPGYKTLALMQEAALALADGKNADAAKLYDQAAAAAPNQIFGDLARLRAAQALLDTAPFAQLQTRLTPLTDSEAAVLPSTPRRRWRWPSCWPARPPTRGATSPWFP